MVTNQHVLNSVIAEVVCSNLTREGALSVGRTILRSNVNPLSQVGLH